MSSRSVELTEHFDRLIEDSVTSGRYADAGEVIREALRLLEQRDRQDQAKLDWLRGAIKEGLDGIDSGEGIEFETIDELTNYVDRIGEEVAAEIASERKRA